MTPTRTTAGASHAARLIEPSRSVASTRTASGSSVKTRWLIVVFGVISSSTSAMNESSGTRRAGAIGPDGRRATMAAARGATEAAPANVRQEPSGTDDDGPWRVETIQTIHDKLTSWPKSR